MPMQIYQVPVGTLRPADLKASDDDRLHVLGCHTVVRRWEVVEAVKSAKAKGIAGGIALGVVFTLLLGAALL